MWLFNPTLCLGLRCDRSVLVTAMFMQFPLDTERLTVLLWIFFKNPVAYRSVACMMVFVLLKCFTCIGLDTENAANGRIENDS